MLVVFGLVFALVAGMFIQYWIIKSAIDESETGKAIQQWWAKQERESNIPGGRGINEDIERDVEGTSSQQEAPPSIQSVEDRCPGCGTWVDMKNTVCPSCGLTLSDKP